MDNNVILPNRSPHAEKHFGESGSSLIRLYVQSRHRITMHYFIFTFGLSHCLAMSFGSLSE